MKAILNLLYANKYVGLLRSQLTLSKLLANNFILEMNSE